jgi:transposase
LETDATRMCALLVGLPDVVVVGVGDWPSWLRIVVTIDAGRPTCECGGAVHRHGDREVVLVDLPVFGRPTRLVWRKQRWRCTGCGRCWCDDDPEIGTTRCALTTPAARWATFQVRRHGLAVADVARDLGCGWHTVMDAVIAIGEQLIDHPDRIGTVNALGLDETLFTRVCEFRTQLWSTQIVDVRRGQLLDVVPGRDSTEPCRWLADHDPSWLAAIEWATLDLSASYRTVFDTMLPDAVQVADPFHVVRLANTALDECRRRVQNETLGHRGCRGDPRWRARRRLTIARERLSADQHHKLIGPLRAGGPHKEVWFAWNAKEVFRQIYDHTNVELATEWVVEIGRDFTDREMPFGACRLGRTIARWTAQIVAWNRSHVTNGPTEAVNNLAKRIKRVAFGLLNSRHHRVRCLLYADKPD